jgi:DNA polymerase-3 subunit epsilon
MRQIILDTETTGLSTSDGHRIIEIGCIELVNRKFTGKRYHQYINPEREVEAGALEVHGITNEFLQGKPVFIQIVKEFMDFINGAELIIHNAPFDVGFINYELILAKQSWKPVTHYCQIIDSLVIARQLHIGQRNSLDALCKRYAVDSSQREFHGALLDAHLLAQVYLAMTGGQSSFFDESQASDSNEQVNVASEQVAFIPRELMVLSANEDELTSHQAKLNKMAEKGKCLWLDN